MKKIFLLFLIFIFSCSKPIKKEEKLPVVEVKTAIKKDCPIFVETIGHVEPFLEVEVRTRVEGELQKVFFKEGDFVKKGTPLFLIDPRPFIALLNEAKAELGENIASLALAKDTMDRNEALVNKQYISEVDWHSMVTNVEKIEAMIEKNKAQIEKSSLNVEYCHIFSPIDGVTGFIKIQEGNIIEPNSTSPLVTILKIDPIYVTFSIPEKYLLEILKRFPKEEFLVKVFSDETKTTSFEGKLNLINNSVDPSTGMIKLRAIFENSEKKLWPRLFLPTRLILKISKDAIVIPFDAVMITSEGPKVFVAFNGSIDLRTVELGERLDDEVIVLKGILENEKVVTKGQIFLKPQMKVTIKESL